jgi:hypothetical protein
MYLKTHGYPAEAIYCPSFSVLGACRCWVFDTFRVDFQPETKTFCVVGKKERMRNAECTKFIEFAIRPRCYTRYQKTVFRDIVSRYDKLIVGSDQVWNPDITDTDLSYFLDFCGAETKRISYAPSFGIESFPEEFCNTVVKELEQFSAISVREENGQKMIRQYLEREVPLVLDPTMLIGRTEWSELEKPYPIENEQYILYYTIRKSDELFRFCREFAEKKGMKVVVVGGNMLKKLRNSDKNIIYANDISPEQWLYLMHHAGFVITNSFHGTAFSINYHKEFYVELSSYTNSRLRQIMKTTGLEERIFKTDISPESECIDYEEVDNKLSVLCSNSMKFLENALREDFANG